MQQVSSPLFGALRSSNDAGEKTITPRRGPNSSSPAMMQGSDSPRGPSTIPGSGAATTTIHHTSVGQAINSIPFEIRCSNSSTSNPNSLAAKPAVPSWSAARPYTHTSLALASAILQEYSTCVSRSRIGKRSITGLTQVTIDEMKKEALQVEDKCSCDGSLVGFVPGPGQYAESVRSTSSRGKAPLQADVIANSIVHFRDNSATSVLSVTSDTPRHACANTVPKLLDQSTEIHDETGCKPEGVGAFIKQRSSMVKIVRAEQPRHDSSFTGGSATMANGGASLSSGGVAAILGMKVTGGTRGGDEDEVEEELTHSEGFIGFAQ
ncbi:hypothetical protein M378DRAFT_16843 [Amanita muscaria Koide BX008]|uniref:Uncharacterized protein n=1 Tax=Amanita muscaria (strain Koide BX008) TaxID=946122 RepID=A0A0C2SRR8_AMAMK|nr:hypothetical protein M378DRAFT_16843 [Amanita muscaria Koide BX008]